ncbi:putative transmembrane protein [Helianthus annuus]|nr:putative transmembrane protein [Helianthus annuus]
MGDTCVAMDEWVQNPTAHTALDDILPCIDHATAQETLFQTKDVTFQLVDTVNKIITNVANIDPLPFPGLLNYNQSGPLVPTLCNPLNADKTDRKCQDGELDASNAAQVAFLEFLDATLLFRCQAMLLKVDQSVNQFP